MDCRFFIKYWGFIQPSHQTLPMLFLSRLTLKILTALDPDSPTSYAPRQGLPYSTPSNWNTLLLPPIKLLQYITSSRDLGTMSATSIENSFLEKQEQLEFELRRWQNQ